MEGLWEESSHRLYTNWVISSLKNGLPKRKSVNYKQTFVVKKCLPLMIWSWSHVSCKPRSTDDTRILGLFSLLNKIQLWSPCGLSLWVHGLAALRITWEAFWTWSFLGSRPRDSVTADVGVGPGNLFSKFSRGFCRSQLEITVSGTIWLAGKISWRWVICINALASFQFQGCPYPHDLLRFRGEKEWCVVQGWEWSPCVSRVCFLCFLLGGCFLWPWYTIMK